MNRDDFRIARALIHGYLPFRSHPNPDVADGPAPEHLFGCFFGVHPDEPAEKHAHPFRFIKASEVIDIVKAGPGTPEGYLTKIRTNCGFVASVEHPLTLIIRHDAALKLCAIMENTPPFKPLDENLVPERCFSATIVTAFEPLAREICYTLQGLTRATFLMEARPKISDVGLNLACPYAFVTHPEEVAMDRDEVITAVNEIKEHLNEIAEARLTKFNLVVQCFNVLSMKELHPRELPASARLDMVGGDSHFCEETLEVLCARFCEANNCSK